MKITYTVHITAPGPTGYTVVTGTTLDGRTASVRMRCNYIDTSEEVVADFKKSKHYRRLCAEVAELLR